MTSASVSQAGSQACADCWLDRQSYSDSWLIELVSKRCLCPCFCVRVRVCVCCVSINKQSSRSSQFHFSASWIMSVCTHPFDVLPVWNCTAASEKSKLISWIELIHYTKCHVYFVKLCSSLIWKWSSMHFNKY